MVELGQGRGRYPEAMIMAAADQVSRCTERWDSLTPRAIAVEVLDAARVDQIMAGQPNVQQLLRVEGDDLDRTADEYEKLLGGTDRVTTIRATAAILFRGMANAKRAAAAVLDQ